MSEIISILTFFVIILAIILCILALLLPFFVFRIYKDIQLIRDIIVEASTIPLSSNKGV